MTENKSLSYPKDETELEERLSRPTPAAIEALGRCPGDIVVLGVAGKIGRTLAVMARRSFDELGRKDRVIGVSRFSDEAARSQLAACGVEPIRCDLLDRSSVLELPEAENVLYLAGQKFGTSSQPELTWAMNTLVPAYCAEKYHDSRIVAFSTGCVYPLTPIHEGGSREDMPLGPPGDYANSCVGRERIFTYFSVKNATKVAIFRLNYAIDLRYGVLLDIAQKVWSGQPVDVSTACVNVIWQGDANAQALQCLEHADHPPFVINITGPETIPVRAIALRFSQIYGQEVRFFGDEGQTAWLNNASKSHSMFGYPSVALDTLIEWTAAWVRAGGSTLGKPTHFEARDGQF